MRRLENAPELLDGPLDGRILAGNLRDLERVNRWFGGTSLSWRALKPLLREPSGGPLRVLDIGTGSADIPRNLVRNARREGADLRFVATDVRTEIVDFARNAAEEDPSVVVDVSPGHYVDAPDDAFDVAHASLLLHHLEPPEACRLLAEMQRVARRAVIVNDLDRGRLWLLGAWLLSRTATRNVYTRHDGPLSVRRAYTPAEVVSLAGTVGLDLQSAYRARPPYRYALVFTRSRRNHG